MEIGVTVSSYPVIDNVTENEIVAIIIKELIVFKLVFETLYVLKLFFVKDSRPSSE